MKHIAFVVLILAMAGLNWSFAEQKVYSAGGDLKSFSSKTSATGAAVLIGLVMAVYFTRQIYLRIRDILDRGVVTYPRFRIPASLKLFPHRHAYWLLLVFTLTQARTSVSSGNDSFGSYNLTREWSFGSHISMVPFFLAALCITLWNIFWTITPEIPSDGEPLGLSSQEA